LVDALGELGGAGESVNLKGESVAGVEVGGLRGAHGAAGDGARGGAALQAGEGLARVEAEAGVEREGAVVEGGLHEAHAGSASFGGAVHDDLHESAARAAVLHGGIDGDGTDAVDDGALVKAVAADDASVAFGNDAVEAGAGERDGEQADGGLGRGEVAGKVVLRIEDGEGVVTDAAADGGVFRAGGTDGGVGGHSNLCLRESDDGPDRRTGGAEQLYGIETAANRTRAALRHGGA
jgi:hypothetical protein